MVLLFYYKGMLEKVTMQGTRFSVFFVAKRTDAKELSKMQRMCSKSKIAIEWKADLEICLYLENRS